MLIKVASDSSHQVGLTSYCEASELSIWILSEVDSGQFCISDIPSAFGWISVVILAGVCLCVIITSDVDHFPLYWVMGTQWCQIPSPPIMSLINFFFFISQVCYYGVGNELLRPHSTGTSKMRSFESRAHRRAAAWAFRFNLLFCFIAYIFGICTDLRFLVDRKSVALPPVLQYNYRGQSWILLTEACPHLNVHSWNQIDSLETSCMNLTVRRELIKFLNNLNMHSWNQMDSLEVEVTFMDDIGDTVNYRILCEIMGLH